jgi:hypothetical protein
VKGLRLSRCRNRQTGETGETVRAAGGLFGLFGFSESHEIAVSPFVVWICGLFGLSRQKWGA